MCVINIHVRYIPVKPRIKSTTSSYGLSAMVERSAVMKAEVFYRLDVLIPYAYEPVCIMPEPRFKKHLYSSKFG